MSEWLKVLLASGPAQEEENELSDMEIYDPDSKIDRLWIQLLDPPARALVTRKMVNTATLRAWDGDFAMVC